MRIKITNYNLNINKKIIVISDLHYRYKSDIKRLNILKDKIIKLNPDYICIPGDIINSSDIKNEDILINWFSDLSKVSKIIISLGNHEFYSNEGIKFNTNLFNKINSIENIKVLDNENIEFEDINFFGLTLPITYYKEQKESYEVFSKNYKVKTIENKYNVLLCHSPINIVKSDLKNIDLVLCGHMHKGLLPDMLKPLFKGRGLVNPLHQILPKNNCCYGIKKVNSSYVIVSSGINLMNNILRNIFSSEIVVIK